MVAGETCKVSRSFIFPFFVHFNSKSCVNVNYKIVEMMKMHIFDIVGGRATICFGIHEEKYEKDFQCHFS